MKVKFYKDSEEGEWRFGVWKTSCRCIMDKGHRCKKAEKKGRQLSSSIVFYFWKYNCVIWFDTPQKDCTAPF